VSPPAAAVAELATLLGVDFDIAEYSYGTGTAQLDLAKEFVPKATIADTPPKGDERWRGCVNAWVRDLLDSGRMVRRLDYWLAQLVT
jgi:hypothetical protein